jgi:hypothetical protein
MCNDNKYELGIREHIDQETLLNALKNETNSTILSPLTCVVKQVTISDGHETVAQYNGPTCEADKWCRTLSSTTLDEFGNGLFHSKVVHS